MEIISHRGYWLDPQEKNTLAAFERSFELGFGTETDVRDLDGELVISHDMPRNGAMPFAVFLDIYMRFDCPGTLALNIKSDGLQHALKAILNDRKLDSYFLFDMSVPDLRTSISRGLRSFTRKSDIELTPPLLDKSDGIWVDSFEKDWLSVSELNLLLKFEKNICIVSPELHGREPMTLWSTLAAFKGNPNVILCTDLPEKARSYFFGG